MRNRDVVRVTAVVALTVFGLYLVYALRHVVLLAGVSAFLAIALEPGVTFLQRFVRSRALAIAIMLFALVFSVAAFVASVVPPISEQVGNLIDNIPEYSETLQNEDTTVGRLFTRYRIPERLQSVLGNASAWATGIGSVFGTVASVITNVLVVLVLTLYFLANAPRIKREGLRLLPTSRRARVGAVVDQVFGKVGGWMEGNILISVVAGIVAFVGLLLIGVPYPHALAMWVAIADLIPMVGAMLGALVCTLVAAIAGGPVQGAITLAFFLAYQQIENYVIQPRVMKRTVDVSPATVILSAMAGGALLGPIGVLLAVPAAASVKVVLGEVMHHNTVPAPARAEEKTA